MNHKEFRIYQYLSDPLTFMGLTLDELVVGLLGFCLFMFVPSLILKGLMGVGVLLSVWVMKKGKKMVSGFSLSSFIHWHLGIMKDRPFLCPPSWKRSFMG